MPPIWSAREDDPYKSSLREHLNVVCHRALRSFDRDSQLGHRGRPLVEQAEDRVAEGMAERLDRFYGRTARLFYVAVERSADGDELPRDFNDLEVAASESAAAYRDGKLRGFIRHARISEAQVAEFWERMADLVTEFDRLPRSGETVYGFAVGVYPTDFPALPDR